MVIRDFVSDTIYADKTDESVCFKKVATLYTYYWIVYGQVVYDKLIIIHT